MTRDELIEGAATYELNQTRKLAGLEPTELCNLTEGSQVAFKRSAGFIIDYLDMVGALNVEEV